MLCRLHWTAFQICHLQAGTEPARRPVGMPRLHRARPSGLRRRGLARWDDVMTLLSLREDRAKAGPRDGPAPGCWSRTGPRAHRAVTSNGPAPAHLPPLRGPRCDRPEAPDYPPLFRKGSIGIARGFSELAVPEGGGTGPPVSLPL